MNTSQDVNAEAANERSALLPRFLGSHRGNVPENTDTYALTPLFYWIRSTSVGLLLITIICHLFLLLNIFISIPIISHLSPGFMPVGFTALAAILLAMQIMFVYSPNAPERVTQRIICFLLAIDVLVVFLSPILRHREGWRSNAFVLWAFLMSLWIVITDLMLFRQYKEEHPDYDAIAHRGYYWSWSPSTWPWRQVGSLTASTILSVILTILTIHTLVTLIMRAYDGALSAPGQLYTVTDSKARVHLECFGSSSSNNKTTVLVEGGEVSVHPFKEWLLNLQHTSPDLYEESKDFEGYENDVKPYLSPDTRVCVWDRPGMGWSDNIGSPSSVGIVMDLLTEALAQADVSGPYVLVAHGIGGVYSNVFAARHLSEVKGIVFVDAGSVQTLKDSGRFLSRFLLFVRGWLSPLGINRIFGSIFMGKTRQDRVYGMYSWTSDRWVKSKIEESLTGPSFSRYELQSAQSVLPKDLPVSVISAGKSMKRFKKWPDEQRQLSKLTQRTVWDIVNNAPHDVWLSDDGGDLIMKRLGEIIYGGWPN
ncbi:Hydrolase [Schizosaccharomyces pombe]